MYMLTKVVSATPRERLSHLHLYLSGAERIKEHKSLTQHRNTISSIKELLFIKDKINSKLYFPQYTSKQSGIGIFNGLILPKKLNIFY